ncbi:MAG TPA: alpha/beta hydrolase [Actinoplanes sp.]|nr:alpha/beta hydrolase [Actinoplanes sp.]
MAARHLMAALVGALVVLPIAACSPAPAALTTGGVGAAAQLSPPQSAAPANAFPVGVRSVTFTRAGRQLPTTVWYPARDGVVGAVARRAVPAAVGRFPLVVFSHGLSGVPQRYAGLAQAWAAAGFVVAAPLYPHTSGRTKRFVRGDINNQPADAWHVIDRLRKLTMLPGDVLSGRLDADRVAAVGHSAGGFTTSGMFTPGHDARLVAGVIIAGWLAPGAFAGPPTNLLFLHGERDGVVPVAASRLAYDHVPAAWPKSFRILHGSWHSEYLKPGGPGFPTVCQITTDFLRWNLYGDDSAFRRLPPSNAVGGPVSAEDLPTALSPVGP